MRYVKYRPTEIIPAEWFERAEKLQTEINAADPGNRSQIIKNNQDLWQTLKNILSSITNNKCWYTEAPQDGTDSDVDHFRPKNSVEGVLNIDTNEKHPGYWWLAFDPTNYRFSCIYANRKRKDSVTGNVGGKRASFPIWNENNRAWCPEDSCEDEQPLLIDPCNEDDVSLIIFAANGEAFERFKETDDEYLFQKAQTSIILYNINYSAFCSRRQFIRDRIVRFIEDADLYFGKLDADNEQINHAYARAIEEIAECCSDRAPYSGFAVSFLESYRHKESLEELFLQLDMES